MPQQKDIVKIAIQMPGAYPQLIQLDQVTHSCTGSSAPEALLSCMGNSVSQWSLFRQHFLFSLFIC